MKLRNLLLALRHQLPLKRAFVNFFVTRNAWGMLHRNSHVRADSGYPKVSFPSMEKALKAAGSMQKKYDGVFRPYKCVFCDGYHVGKNRV